MLYTFQDFMNDAQKSGIPQAIHNAINTHVNSDAYKIAKSADAYDHQQNETIYNYIHVIFSIAGAPIEDFTATNNKIASNFFHRLNTQRNTYLLGNGVSFTKHVEKQKDEEGNEVSVDTTKEALGSHFDIDLINAGYYALIHKVSFGFWNVNKMHVFTLPEFVPLWDEDDGSLRAGIRFWRIDESKPMICVLYEEDGYTKYKSRSNTGLDFAESQPKRAYKTKVRSSEVDGEEVIGEENYGTLPIIPLWGSRLKQSTLVGMQKSIDSFDLIRSGFANDLTDCAEIYWILENCSGMTDEDLSRFRDRLKINHIAVVDTENESKATPYTQEIPYQARKEYLDMIRAGIYEDFGGLDVHAVEANSTNDHLEAAYQPLDEEADDFETQVTDFIKHILALMGIDDEPIYKRNRISNQMETVQMVMMEADKLDDETLLKKLPNITVDEISKILANKDRETNSRFENANSGVFASLDENEEE